MTIQDILDKSFEDFKNFCDNRHNIYVNQFYDEGITYSFHTNVVLLQGEKFLHLITDNINKFIVKCGLKGHDLIEDARLSYNDIKESLKKILIKNGILEFYHKDEVEKICVDIAEIVFQCSDFRGMSREERKPIQYYNELSQNKLAIFVKISDIIGNVKYGLLTNSSKLENYKKEWHTKVRKILHTGTQKHIFFTDNGSIYQEMFEYLDKILEL